MATSNFILRGSNPNKPHSIVLIFRYGKSTLKYPTGYKIKQEFWNEDKQELRNRVEVIDRNKIQEDLLELKNRIHSVYNSMLKEDIPIDNDELRQRLGRINAPTQKKTLKPNYVQDFIDDFISNSEGKLVLKGNGTTEPLKKTTFKQYFNTLRKIKAFDAYVNERTRFKDLDLQFHSKFLSYLKDEEGLAHQTIGARIRDIKTMAKHARRLGADVHDDVFSREFFKPTDESDYPYLNRNEIQSIYNCDLSSRPMLDNARDLLIIGLWTGLRISDLSRLHINDFKDGFIQIKKQQKTGLPIIIPIHPQVQEVIDKYDGDLPRFISPQKFNDYIKEVSRLAGIDALTRGTKREMTIHGPRKVTGIFPKYELVTSHICRRSFASNHYGKISNMVIMGITGHKSEKTFLKYIKVTPQEHAENLKRYWLEQNSL